MRTPVRPAVVTLTLTLALGTGCVSRMAEQLRAELVGLDAGSLQACMGDPWEVDRREGAEVWVYQERYPHRPEDVSLDASTSAITPNVPNVSAGGEVDRSTTKSSSYRPDNDPIQPGSCYLFFALEGDEVGAIEAAGRSWEGVGSDDECLLLARKCRP